MLKIIKETKKHWSKSAWRLESIWWISKHEKKVYSFTMFGWFRYDWILISLIIWITNFRSILNLSILFKANKCPVLFCLKFQQILLCDEDLAQFSRTQSATDWKFVYVDTARLLFRVLILVKEAVVEIL